MVQFIQEPLSPMARFAEGFGEGAASGLQGMLQQLQQKNSQQAIESDLISKGYPPALAKLASVSTTGGRTDITKYLLEQMKRADTGTGREFASLFGEQLSEEEQIPQAEQDIGLTPGEKVKRGEGRFKAQLPKYEELEKKVNTYQQNGMRIQRLQQLNESGKLPSGLARANVDKEGNLRLPFLAGADAEEAVKTVNDFLVGAKDTFGSRVTNFDIQSFMKRLPTLMNSEEGRRRVLRQMEIINELNMLHDKGVLDVFDKKGGIRAIDYDQATKLARHGIKDREKELKKEYVEGERSLSKIGKSKSASPKIRVQAPDGKFYQIPAEKWKDAKGRGFKRA